MCKSPLSLRLSTMRRYLAAGLLSLACAGPNDRTDGRHSNSMSVGDSLVLERTTCYGTCPAYRLRVTNTGEIRFESRNPGDQARTGVDTVAAGTLPFLISRAMAVGFFELPQEIVRDSVLCRNRATDHPTVVVTIFMTSTAKAVTDYHGCFETREHGVVPRIERLRSFESEIDSVLQSSQWVRPARRG